VTEVLAHYDALVAAGELRPDASQRGAAIRLDDLQSQLEGMRGGKPIGLIGRLLGRKPHYERGVYLWGGVGRGKSMLMDLFFDCLGITRKRRAHFHAFMLDVHARLRDVRKGEQGDPIPIVAAAIARDIDCLCFDEMVVTNSADAMIMGRLFAALIRDHQLTIVTTSNRAPSDLYKDGLNREHFLPFIALVESALDVIALNGPTDYRRDRLGDTPLWHVPADEAATAALSAAFFRLTDYPPEDRAHVPRMALDVGGGRTLDVPKALKGVAVFSFKRLCAEARGAADYLSIAQAFHTVIIVGIPQMGPENRNEAARFVTLIDALYEYRVKLLASAAAAPDALYMTGDGAFEFERTASRLSEMQSDAYLALGHGVDPD
jgi:cell division protein ZapE